MTNPTPPRAAVPAQPDALRLSEALENPINVVDSKIVAAELRRLHALSVEHIMLGITPGLDGMGHEVYAKSVADVEAALSAMGEKLENYELGITAQGAAERAVPAGTLHDIDAGVEVMAYLRESRAPHSIYAKMSACLFGDPDRAASPAQQVSNMTGWAYAPLPNFDDGAEPIWNAIFNWKTAERGADASQKAMKVESAIADQLRAYADATHALRASHAQAPAGAASDTVTKERLKEILGKPETVHLNMLNGNIALITMEQCAHLHGEEMQRKWAAAQAAPAAGAVAGPVYRIRNKKSASQIWTQVSESEYRNALTMPAQFECSQVAPTPAAQADSEPMLIDWTTPDDPVQALDNIMAVYEKCMGTTPGPEMAHIVRKTKEMLFDWWGRYRESARDAMAQADSGVQEDAAASHWVVMAPCGQGVVFADKADAKWTLTGRGAGADGFGVPTIGDAFRESYDEGLVMVPVDIRAALAAKGQKP